MTGGCTPTPLVRSAAGRDPQRSRDLKTGQRQRPYDHMLAVNQPLPPTGRACEYQPNGEVVSTIDELLADPVQDAADAEQGAPPGCELK